MSIDIGCVRLTEQELHHDPPRRGAEHRVRDGRRLPRRRPSARFRPCRDARTFVGLAGTITTVAAVEIGLAEYDRDAIHHFLLTHAAAEDVFRTLATEPLADRMHNPGLSDAPT